MALAHPKGSATPKFGVSFQHGPAGGGRQLLRCAVLAGLGQKTRVHGVGDGAVWITNQMEEQFGAQGTYLVDLYPACEYLAAAATACSPDQPVAWRQQQKQRLKQSDTITVLKALESCCEPQTTSDAEAPVRTAHRYLSNRIDQLDYQRTLEQGLPIGSG